MSYKEILADQELNQKELELEAQLEPLSKPITNEFYEVIIVLLVIYAYLKPYIIVFFGF